MDLNKFYLKIINKSGILSNNLIIFKKSNEICFLKINNNKLFLLSKKY